jgi:hypothetical protein
MSSFDAGIYPQSGASRAPLQEEPSLHSALQPEAVMPVQFYGARRGGEQVEAVKRLMCAILEDALRCFERNLQACTTLRRREFREAENWLFSRSEGEGLFSFENVCDALGVDPNRLRRAISQRRASVLTCQTPNPLLRRSPVIRASSKSVLLGARANRAKRQPSG